MRLSAKVLALAAIGFALGWAALNRHGPSRAAFVDCAAATEDKPKALSSEQAWQRLKAGNSRFAEGMSQKPDVGASRLRELSKGQKPFAVILTCADSRLTPEFIFNQGLGELFVLRVAGNIADPFVLGSMEYAVDHLRVPLIVVLGHEKCGAVEAGLGATKPTGTLGKLVAEIDVGHDLPKGTEAALAAAIQNNVRRQTRLLTERSSVIQQHVAKKEVRIVSGIYQLATGKVDWLRDQ